MIKIVQCLNNFGVVPMVEVRFSLYYQFIPVAECLDRTENMKPVLEIQLSVGVLAA